MTLPTAEYITNLFLFGQPNKPDNLAQEKWIRSPSDVVTMTIDVNEYMAGPGRFAIPSGFELVRKFLNPSLYSDSNSLSPGVYEGNHGVRS